MILKEKLAQYNVSIVKFSKGETIFESNTSARYYFQIIRGGVKMNYYSDSGNEFIQGIFGKGKSFGEPPLLIDVNYPANAVAISDTTMYVLEKEQFKKLLLEHSEIHYSFSKMIAERLYFKATMANGITSNSAEEAILTLFQYLKNNVYESDIPFGVKIDFTRKHIAGLLGLSVETTIRTIKKMEKQQLVKIINTKVYF